MHSVLLAKHSHRWSSPHERSACSLSRECPARRVPLDAWCSEELAAGDALLHDHAGDGDHREPAATVTRLELAASAAMQQSEGVAAHQQ
jgi:hypothetical protein